jgi:hypothetical protein
MCLQLYILIILYTNLGNCYNKLILVNLISFLFLDKVTLFFFFFNLCVDSH